MKKNKLLLVVLMTALLLALIIPTQAYAVATSQSLLRVAWNHDPVTVYISLQKGVDSAYYNDVVTAFTDWSNALNSDDRSGFDFDILNAKPTKRNPADITVSVRKNTGMVLGSTSVKARNGIISSASISLAAYKAVGISMDRSDFRTIARHEIGHALGLGHSNDDGTGDLDLMAPTFDFTGVNEDIYPSTLNIGALVYIYENNGFRTPNISPIPDSYSLP
jgi:hypothetical protein